MSDAPDPRARGVANPYVVDLVEFDTERDQVVLVMLEARDWGVDDQLPQLEDKLNSYLSYVASQGLARDYPQYQGKTVRFQLECSAEPGEVERPFLGAVQSHCTEDGIGFEVVVMPAEMLAER